MTGSYRRAETPPDLQSLLKDFRSLYFGPDPATELRPTKLSVDTWAQGYGQRLTRSWGQLLLWIRSGRVILELDGEETTCREGWLVIMDPTAGVARCRAMAETVIASVGIAGPAADALVEESLGARHGAWDLSRADEVARCWRELTRLLDHEGPLLPRRVALGIRQVLLAVHEVRLQGAPADAHASRYLEVRRVIERHFTELRSVGEIAARCGVSPTHVARLFRRHADVTPLRFLQELQMAMAADLLATTALPVATVAERVGYDDPFVFSKTFKRIVGASPSAHREAHGG